MAILAALHGPGAVGYLSYSNRHADLMFELVSRRYQNRSTLITTNRPFAEWREVFPNAACVVSLIDRPETKPLPYRALHDEAKATQSVGAFWIKYSW